MAIINKKVTTQAQTQFHVGTDGNLVMAMGSNGNVGIGNTDPTAKLEVGNGSSTYVKLRNASTGDISSGYNIESGSTTTTSLYGNASEGWTTLLSGGSLHFRVNNAVSGFNPLNITTSGIITVGTTTTDPVSGAYAGTTSAMVVDSDVVHTSAASANQTLTLKGNNNYQKLCLLADSTYESGQLRWFNSSGSSYIGFIDVRNSASSGMTLGSVINGGCIRLTARNSDGSGGQVERVRISEHGMTFNGDTAAANALDDYEEGTYSPTLANVSNITSLSLSEAGRYVKIGHLVHFECQVSGNFTSASSEARFSFTLPFNTATTSPRAVGMFAFLKDGAFSNDRFSNGQVYQGTNLDYLMYVYIGSTQIPNNGDFTGRLTFTYQAA